MYVSISLFVNKNTRLLFHLLNVKCHETVECFYCTSNCLIQRYWLNTSLLQKGCYLTKENGDNDNDDDDDDDYDEWEHCYNSME